MFEIYQAFASAEQTAAMAQAFADGIAWGEAKQQLFEQINAELAPMRAQYEVLMAHPARLEEILQAGAAKARLQSRARLAAIREAVGIRTLV